MSKARQLADLGNVYDDGALSNRNRIINGGMVIDQRNAGSAVNTNDAFPVDRWKMAMAGGGVISAQRSTVAPAGFYNSLGFTVSTADASIAAGDAYFVTHNIEGYNAADLGFGTANAQSVTISFRVRSSVTGTYTVAIGNSAFNRLYVATYSISAADTWETKTVTIAGDTSGTWLADNGIGLRLYFDLGSGSAYNASSADAWLGSGVGIRTSGSVNWIANAGATFYITGVQLEAGDTATPFEHRSYGQELALCQRYFLMWRPQGTGATEYPGVGFGYASGPSSHIIGIKTPVTLRSTPTVSFTGSLTMTSGALGAGFLSSVSNVYQPGPGGFWISCFNTAGTATNGYGSFIYLQNSTANSFSASAEL
jgi:hypothetical protein